MEEDGIIVKDPLVFKICIVGCSFDLTKQIIRLVADQSFPMHYSQTIGVDILSKIMKYRKVEIRLIFHVVRREEAFGRSQRFYYEGSIGCVIIFDKGVRASFETVDRYCQEYRSIQGLEKPIVLLGVIVDSEEVSYDEGKT